MLLAGLVVTGLGYFQAAGIFGPLYPYEARPWCNEIIWDTSGCCSSTDNKFWEIIKALFGYTGGVRGWFGGCKGNRKAGELGLAGDKVS